MAGLEPTSSFLPGGYALNFTHIEMCITGRGGGGNFFHAPCLNMWLSEDTMPGHDKEGKGKGVKLRAENGLNEEYFMYRTSAFPSRKTKGL